MQHKRILGALALVLSLCFISSATVINSDNTDNSQDIVLGDPIDFGEIVFYFDTNGGTLEVGSGFGEVELEVGDNYRLYTTFTGYVLPTPTKDGYIFAGWYFDESFTDPFQTSDAVDGSHMPILYAKWIKTPTDGTVLSDDGNRLITAPSDAVDYVIPDGVTTIAGYAFFKCNNMQSITFPESVKTLEAHTFDGLGLITVYIPHSATYMDQVPPFFNIVRTGIERTYPAPTADNYNANSNFEIHTPDELKTFALAVTAGNTYENKTVYLAKDLDMSGVAFTPIGDRSNIFNGTFDGQGHVISSLAISSSEYVGFFYYLGEKGIVRNFGLDSTCRLTCENDTAVAYAGGIALANRGTIENCFNGASIQSSTSGRNTTCTASGIVDSNSGTITNCYNFGSVTVNSSADLDAYERTAGISDSNSGTITNCYNIGNLGSSYSGYIAITNNQNGGTTVNCYWLTTGSSTSEAKTEAEFKSPNMISLLGDAYRQDITGVNNGYPILSWQASGYIVTFNSNGGSDVAAQAVKEGENAVRPADPTKQGFVFGGWYTNVELTTEYTFTTPVTENITLYAKWYEDVIFTSVPSVSDITATVDGRTVNVQVKAQNYAKILWDMGNGDVVTTYQPALTYTYDKSGDYKITATAINDVGESEPIVQNVAISDDNNNNSENEANYYWIIGIILAIIIAVVVIGVIKS